MFHENTRRTSVSLHPLLQLQKTAGNQRVVSLLRSDKPMGLNSQKKNISTGVPVVQRQIGDDKQTDFTPEQVEILKSNVGTVYEIISSLLSVCKGIFVTIPAKGEELDIIQKLARKKIVFLVEKLFGEYNAQVIIDLIWNLTMMKSVMKGAKYTYYNSVDTAEAVPATKVIKIGNGYFDSDSGGQKWILLHEVAHLAYLRHTGGFQANVYFGEPECPPHFPEIKTEEAVQNADINAGFVYCAYRSLLTG